jgi:anti-sigma factor RsiW
MKKKFKHTTATRPGTSCTESALGARVPDYILDLLNDEEAESVEKHLLECNDCRETYLAVIRIRETGRRRRVAGSPG